jgi:hypothetical protein
MLVVLAMLAALPASVDARRGPVKFRLSGSVEGLYPGARRTMRVTVRNPFARAMRLLSVHATAGRGGRLCSGRNIAVRPFRGRLRIPARRRRVVRLLVAMEPTAAEECKRARFPVRFRGRAVLR